MHTVLLEAAIQGKPLFASAASAQVRAATPEDLQATASLFDEYIQGAGKPSNLSKTQAYLSERLMQKDSKIFLALKDNLPIGFIQLFRQFGATSMSSIWYIQDLFVQPRARRQGLATALLNKAKETATEDGSLLTLKTRVENDRAQKLYESEDFQETERSNKFVYYAWES